jgi:hypothetical protein
VISLAEARVEAAALGAVYRHAARRQCGPGCTETRACPRLRSAWRWILAGEQDPLLTATRN